MDGSAQLLLRHDSSVVRALVRITRGPGFDPQLRRLNFFRFSVRMSVLSFFRRLKENYLFDVFVTVRISLLRNMAFARLSTALFSMAC